MAIPKRMGRGYCFMGTWWQRTCTYEPILYSSGDKEVKERPFLFTTIISLYPLPSSVWTGRVFCNLLGTDLGFVCNLLFDIDIVFCVYHGHTENS